MILLQLYAAILAVALARLNKIPCQKMMNFGASIREEKQWHRDNAIMKLLITFLLVVQIKGSIICMIVAALLFLIIQWAIFDIVLSKLLHGSFWYLGKTSAIDRRFRVIFGVHEGLVKFLICCIVILIINFYL